MKMMKKLFSRYTICAVFILLTFATAIFLAGCEKIITSSPDGKLDASVGINPDSVFEVHFIDVGQADAALIICDGENMLIDGGNTDDSSLIYRYLKDRDITELDYIVATHAHEDHVGGLSGALNFAKAQVALCPVTEYDSKAFSSFVKTLEKQGLEITIPDAGDFFMLGSAEVDILACNAAQDTNNSSIVLKITYGQTSFLFTGDAEYECESLILDSGYDLSSTLLKVGHHGSYTSTSYRFLRETMPEYAVISCGKDNEYGHPHDEVTSRLEDAGVTYYRTDLLGDIVCKSDGKNLTFTFGTVPENARQETACDMVLNTSSRKYHKLSCESVVQIGKQNKKDFHGTTAEVEAMGYKPCGNCH